MKIKMKLSSLGEKLKIAFGVYFQLLKSFLVSLFLSFVLLPFAEKSKLFQNAIKITDRTLLVGITGLLVFLLLISWERFNIFLWKYKNTYKVTRSRFTYVDFIFAVIYFFVIIIFLTFNKDLKISREMAFCLAVNIGLLFLYSISAYLWPQKVDKKSQPRYVKNEVSDEPIHYLDEDLLNRGVFIKGLYDEIKQLNIMESFVFGLYGSWGEGKSSVLNLLRILLKEDNKFVVMSFEPWNFKDEGAMLKAFFSTLEKALSKEYTFPELKKLLFKYQKIISSGLGGIGINIDFGIEEETIDEVKEKIEGYIESTGKKLLVIIDEIDRLEPDEIRMIFKLVRSNSKFKNSIFLLSLDEDKVSDKIESGRKFLEKIIQKPISLPKVEHSFIDKFLLFSDHKIPQYTLSEITGLAFDISISTAGYVTKSENGTINLVESLDNTESASILVTSKSVIGQNFNIGDKVFVEGIHTKDGITLEDPNSRIIAFKLSRIDLLLERGWREHNVSLDQIAYFDKEFVYLFRSQISYLIENFRDAKRFLNSIYSSYPAIADEVSPYDFICLEVIKVFAKKVYDDIFESWWFYVDQRFEGDSFSNPYTFTFSNERDKRKQQTLKHVKTILDSAHLEPRHHEVISHILDSLFPSLGSERSISESDRKNKRIFTSSFLKYFTLSVPSTELSDSFFEDELKTWESKLNEATLEVSFFKLQKQGKLVEFLDKIRRIYLENLSEELLPILLNTISKNIHSFSKRDMGDLWDSEYDRALMLVLITLNLRIEKTQIESEMKKMIEHTPDLLFAVDLVLTTKKERGRDLFNIYDSTDNFALRKLLVSRLEKHYIDEKKDVLEENLDGKGWLRILFQWSSNWSDPSTTYKEKVAKYMVEIFKKDPKTFVEFLKSFNTGSFEKEWSMNYEEYSKIYDLVTLAKLANNLSKNEDLTDEQRKILVKFVSTVDSKKPKSD